MQRIIRLLTILSGSLMAQAISLISLLFITKLYNPLEYGQFAAIILIHSATLPLVLLRLDTFLIVSKETGINQRAFEYSKQIIKRITLVFSAVFLFLLLVMPGNAFVVPQVFVVVLASFISNVLNSILYFHSQTMLVANSSIIQSILTGLLQVIFSSISTSSQSLLVAFVLGRVAGMLPCFIYLRRIIGGEQTASNIKLSRKNILDLNRNNYKWSQIFAFFESMLSLIPVVLCIFVFNGEALGAFMLILAISSGPATMLVSSLTLTELISDESSLSRNSSFVKIVMKFHFLTDSRFAAIIYFFVITSFAFFLRYFGFLNTDLYLFGILSLAFAFQVASTNDFAILVAKSEWILLTKIYFFCFSLSLIVIVIALLLAPKATLLILVIFYLSKSLSLYLTLRVVNRTKDINF